MAVTITRGAAAQIAALPADLRARAEQMIERGGTDPRSRFTRRGDAPFGVGDFGYWRSRSTGLRVLVTIDDTIDEITVVGVGLRNQ